MLIVGPGPVSTPKPSVLAKRPVNGASASDGARFFRVVLTDFWIGHSFVGILIWVDVNSKSGSMGGQRVTTFD